MENLIVCLNAVFPLLATMLLGYVARRMGKLGDNEIFRVNNVAFFFFMPCLLFDSVYKADISSALNPKLIAYITVSLIIIFSAGLFYSIRKFRERADQSAVLMGIFRSNCAILGLPLVKSLMPAGADISVAAIVIVVVAVVNNVLAVLSISIFSGQKKSVAGVLLGLIKNPLLIGSAVGIVFACFGWRLPGAVEKVVSDLSQMSSTLLIFLLGAFFRFESFTAHKRELVTSCFLRLMLIPAVFLTLGWLLGFRGIELASMLAAFASPAAVTSFTMSQQMNSNSKLMGDIIVFTSALCPFTLFIWCLAVKVFGSI